MDDPFLPPPAPGGLPRGTDLDAYFDGLRAWCDPPDPECRNDEREFPPCLDPEYDLRAVVAAHRDFAAVEYARAEALAHRDFAVRALWYAFGPCVSTVQHRDIIPHTYCAICGRLLPVCINLAAPRIELPEHVSNPYDRLGRQRCRNNAPGFVHGALERFGAPLTRPAATWGSWVRDTVDTLRTHYATYGQAVERTLRLREQTPPATAGVLALQRADLVRYVPLTEVRIRQSAWGVDHALVWSVLHDLEARYVGASLPGAYMGLAYVVKGGEVRQASRPLADASPATPWTTETFYHPDVVLLLRIALSGRVAHHGEYARAGNLFQLTRAGREAFARTLRGLLRAVNAGTPDGTAARLDALRGALALSGEPVAPVVRWRDRDAPDRDATNLSTGAYEAVAPLLAGWAAERDPAASLSPSGSV